MEHQPPFPTMAECLTDLDLRTLRAHALNELAVMPMSVNARDKLLLVNALEALGEDIRYYHISSRERLRAEKLAVASAGDCHPAMEN